MPLRIGDRPRPCRLAALLIFPESEENRTRHGRGENDAHDPNRKSRQRSPRGSNRFGGIVYSKGAPAVRPPAPARWANISVFHP
jgi:hypothetical protein